ncbi:MAG: hypothetical protein K2V38_14060 [Gemmataceae bacterium]|nr:hypothetical protein [Gemmataceae bacterium]
MSELLYLDTARLGRMSPGAAAAHRDFAALASDEGGGLYFDRFLAAGLPDCPAGFVDRYPGLSPWEGMGRLKAGLRAVAGCDPSTPVLLASRTASLLRFAARFLFRPCRNVFVTDLDWPAYRHVLIEEAVLAGRQVTALPVLADVLAGRLPESRLVDRVCERFAAAKCDGLFLTAVSNLGVRFPVERVVRRLEGRCTVRAVVVDGAQEFAQVAGSMAVGVSDLYLAGSHKWLGGYHPLGIAFAGRRRSLGRVPTVLESELAAGELDDPLMRLVGRLEERRGDLISETVSLAPVFTAQGAVADRVRAAGVESVRVRNREAAAVALADSGWRPLTLDPEYRTGVLLVQAEQRATRDRLPEATRAGLRDRGIAASAYPHGLVRLSMPASSWQPGELDSLRRILTAVA